MCATIEDSEAFGRDVAGRLFEYACQILKELRKSPGIRVFCANRQLLDHLHRRPWLRYATVYLPSAFVADIPRKENDQDTRIKAAQRHAATQNGIIPILPFGNYIQEQWTDEESPEPFNIPIYSFSAPDIEPDNAFAILERYWAGIGNLSHFPAYFSVFSETKPKQSRKLEAAFGKIRKVNLFLGNCESVKAFAGFFDRLQNEHGQLCIQVSRTGVGDSEAQLTNLSEETTLEIAYLEALEAWVLNRARMPASISFSLSAPENNLNSSDAWYSDDDRVPGDAFDNDHFDVVDSIAKLIREKRFLILGGFAMGTDLLARKALQRIGTFQEEFADPKLLHIQQLIPSATVQLLDTFDWQRRQFLGRGFVFRNLFDPWIFRWDLTKGTYVDPPGFNEVYLSDQQAARVMRPQDGMLQAFSKTCLDPKGDSGIYAVITTQYDSFEDLVKGIRRTASSDHKSSEAQSNALEALNLLHQGGVPFHRVKYPANDKMGAAIVMVNVAKHLEKVGHHLPSWLLDATELTKFALIGGHDTLRAFRPALWRRLIEYLIPTALELVDGKHDAQTLAERTRAKAQSTWEDLHLRSTKFGPRPTSVELP